MAFFEKRFPVGISRGAVGGPGYDNDIIAFHNAREVTISNRDSGLGAWDVVHGIKYIEEFEELLAFFRTMRGDAHQFRYKDWLDYTFLGQVLGTGDGSKQQFNITKTYGDGTNDEVRRLYKIVQNSVDVPETVYLDDVPQGSGFSIDYNNGIVTFTVAPALGVVVKMDGEFDVPARFGIKQMKARWEDYNVVTWGQIMVLEVVPDGVIEAA